MNDESVFIDVREPDEYEEVHAKGVKNVPLASVSAETIGQENKDKTVYLICRSGKRSMTAAKNFKKKALMTLLMLKAVLLLGWRLLFSLCALSFLSYS